jgi:hypothetical protein
MAQAELRRHHGMHVSVPRSGSLRNRHIPFASFSSLFAAIILASKFPELASESVSSDVPWNPSAVTEEAIHLVHESVISLFPIILGNKSDEWCGGHLWFQDKVTDFEEIGHREEPGESHGPGMELANRSFWPFALSLALPGALQKSLKDSCRLARKNV